MLASDVRGSVSCEVHPFDVNAPVGREVFRFICQRQGVPLTEEALGGIMDRLKARPWIPLAAPLGRR